MNQYFKVGEEVELVSKECPELNGDCVISHVIVRDNDATFKCPVTGELFSVTHTMVSANAACYYLHGLMGHDEERPNLWAQSALRKKHQKGESFDTLMEKLNLGVTA